MKMINVILSLGVVTIILIGLLSGCSSNEGESGDPSSPILQLDESWDGVVNGIRVVMSHDGNGRFNGVVFWFEYDVV